MDPLSFPLEGSGSLTFTPHEVVDGFLTRAGMIATAIILTLKSLAIALFSLPYLCSVFSDRAHNSSVSRLAIQLYNRCNSTHVDSKHNITYLCKYLLVYTPVSTRSAEILARNEACRLQYSSHMHYFLRAIPKRSYIGGDPYQSASQD